MKTYLKGETSSALMKFPAGVALVGKPTWRIVDWQDDEILTGQAFPDASGMWGANFIIPKDLVIPNGEQDFTLEFSGSDAKGQRHVRSRILTVIDATDQWQDYGILLEAGSAALEDVAFFDTQPASMSIALREGFGETPTIITALPMNAPTFDRLTSQGYAYKLSLPLSSSVIASASGAWFPHQFVIRAKFADSRPESVVIKPVYILTPTVATSINSMRRYLDKARLDDIDKSLQWVDEELAHFLMEGTNYINSIGEPTFWTVNKMPSNLYSHLVNAACFVALNARFIAEGMNSFEFQGANTQLTFNRRDVIQTKMDELRGILDQYLPAAKTNAIRAFGAGTPPPNALPKTGMANIGTLHISLSPNTNFTRRMFDNGFVSPLGWRY